MFVEDDNFSIPVAPNEKNRPAILNLFDHEVDQVLWADEHLGWTGIRRHPVGRGAEGVSITSISNS